MSRQRAKGFTLVELLVVGDRDYRDVGHATAPRGSGSS